MYGIDVLVKEHENILVFTEYVRKLCCEILEGKPVDVEELRACADFGKNYADSNHHVKEEKLLFRIMMDKIGPLAEKLIRNGMLVEHNLGRYHMGELRNALDNYEENPSTELKLDIITYASGYVDLLKRHIAKEDEVCYTFAERMLSDEDKRYIDQETKKLQDDIEVKDTQNKYLEWLNERKLNR